MTATRVLLSVQVRPESKAKLAKIAEQLGITLSDVTRMALARGIEVLDADFRKK